MGSTARAASEAVDADVDVDVDSLSDGALDAELVALLRLRHRLDAEIARRAARWQARGVWLPDGSRAAWARLSRTAAVAAGTARAIIRRGSALATMPLTAEEVGRR